MPSSFRSVTAIRNYMIGDPIQDWFELYGKANGFIPDREIKEYFKETDFVRFIRDKGKEFEQAILPLIAQKLDIHYLPTNQDLSSDDNLIFRRNETLLLMKQGVEAIWQPVLLDSNRNLVGIPDLLVRSDSINKLVEGSLAEDEQNFPAPKIGAENFYYLPVDIKFTTLKLGSKSMLNTEGSQPHYNAQLALYAELLETTQGFRPQAAFLLGRRWSDKEGQGQHALERLGRAPLVPAKANSRDWHKDANDALQWLDDLETQGHTWKPGVHPLLKPNLKAQDRSWSTARKQIVEQTKDFSRLWNIGSKGEALAREKGITGYDDPKCTGEAIGLSPEKARIFDAILDINLRSAALILPEHVSSEREVWGEKKGVEFYVDFETVSNLDDDFSALPYPKGYPAIFTIGCGHVEDGKWKFERFIAETLDEDGERAMIKDWLRYMDQVRADFPSEHPPVLYHWSDAEVSMAASSNQSAMKRLRENELASIPWYDLLGRVFKSEPITVKGAWDYGLKSVAKSLKSHGLIETSWSDGPTDGLGAMVGAWWCYKEAKAMGIPVGETCVETQSGKHFLMQEIRDYNEVDCKVMWEILRLLRSR